MSRLLSMNGAVSSIWKAAVVPDLVRFGLFTGSKYLWSFKGGSENGQGIPAKFDIYPIPAMK